MQRPSSGFPTAILGQGERAENRDIENGRRISFHHEVERAILLSGGRREAFHEEEDGGVEAGAILP